MNNIKITIDNYKGKQIIFQAPEDALVEVWSSRVLRGEGEGKITQIGIEMTHIKGIDFIEETYDD